MPLSDALQQIRAKIEKHGDNLDNEEITKNVLILPMIQALGYDFSDPTEVRAEYPVPLPRGGKGRADYVIMRNGKPAIVIECKALGVPLDERIQGQMQRYARALDVQAGIVTDGDFYYCYANTENESRLDATWYRHLSLTQLSERDSDALALLSKPRFFPKQLRAKAQEFKNEIQRESQLVDLLSNQAMLEELFRIGAIADADKREEELGGILRELETLIRRFTERLAAGEVEPPKVVTTNEELDAYLLCKGIVHDAIEPRRVHFRDAKTYASVLIDDNNRKPLCRFYFDGRRLQFGLFDPHKRETKYTIDEIGDIFKYAGALKRTARHYASL